MDDRTVRSLHAVAELVIAGPQHREHGTIRLMVTPGGFGAVATSLRVEGTDLVWAGGRAPPAGTFGALAEQVGVQPGPPVGRYPDISGVDPAEQIQVDAGAAAELATWFVRGDAGLRAFAPGQEPVLWPEHFDLAMTVDEVNYGISPGDAGHGEPYAYVGPWTPRTDEFWNASFGGLRAARDLETADAVAAYFGEDRAAAYV